jgi:microcystin-dependent protein
MSDAFVAEIRIFPYTFAPRNWAFCNGQLLSISQNTALFSLLGTNYGGDGRVTFGLPNLQNSVPIQAGQGQGLSSYDLGQVGGDPTVTLATAEMPAHGHNLVTTTTVGTVTASANNQIAKGQAGNVVVGITQGRAYSTAAPNNMLNPATAVGFSGGKQPHNNLMPFLQINYCIALVGIFPPRS